MANFVALNTQLSAVATSVSAIETGVQDLLTQDAQDQEQIDSVASALGDVSMRLEAVVASLAPPVAPAAPEPGAQPAPPEEPTA